LIIWTDCDREGEAIGYDIIDICKAVKPGIEVYRAHFSALTKEDLTNAATNLARPN
jgi:DNA topoisomerase-3